MSLSTISVKTEAKAKKEFAEFCKDVGFNMSSAINLFIKTTLREKRIPFEIRSDLPNEETLLAIDEMNKGKNLSRPYNDVDELMRDLNNA